MQGLPQRTELNNGAGKKISKEKFYSKLDLTGTQERLFIDQISSMRWMNKISSESMNLTVSDDIQEIEIFEIVLKGDDVDEKLLKIIDEAIIHPIVFVIRNDSKERLFIAYKETGESGKTNVIQYYSTEWSESGSSALDVSAINTGEIYKSLITQISNGRVVSVDETELSDLVADDMEFQKALKDIEKLKSRIKKTDQPNKKLELVHELRGLKKKWGVE